MVKKLPQTEDEAEQYLNTIPEWPEFTFFDNEIEGLLPISKAQSWDSFVSHLNDDYHHTATGDMVYRGHKRFDWQLEAKLSRYFDGGSVPKEISGKLLDKFQLAMRGRGNDFKDEEPTEIWAFGQHFGLATPLLDWTESPFVALYFAFLEEDFDTEKPNPSRSIFCLNRTNIETVIPDLFFEPRRGENTRLVNQAGLFTETPPGQDNLVSYILNELIEEGGLNPDNPEEVAKFLCKIHITNLGRKECLEMLRKMNLHHASLFPDALGASQYCNDWLTLHLHDLEEKEKKAAYEKLGDKLSQFGKIVKVTVPEESSEIVAEILLLGLPSSSSGTAISPDQIAEKIESKYSEVASLDWPDSPSGTATVSVALKRVLNMFGYPDISKDAILKQLVSYYEARYRLRSESS